MSIFAKLFDLNIPQWVIEIIAVLGIAGAAVLYLEHRGATDELAKLKSSSAKLLTKAQAAIDKETQAHAAEVAANQEKTDAALKAYDAVSGMLDDRVRDFDAYRASHPDLPRPAGGPAAAPDRSCGTQSCGDLAVQLAERGNDLARSVGELSATLQSCQRDRDALTGLPK